jgi:uncharacterized alpha-E superfamily protein
VLARIAHELFWVGRNLARAEHTARMLDGVFQADLQGRPDDEQRGVFSWDTIRHIMGGRSNGERPATRDEVLRTLTLEADDPASVVACVARAREGARTVRDVISAEMWESMNTTHLMLRDGDLSARLRTGPYSVYQQVRERSALFWGLTARTMLRDEASAFLEAGGRFESGDMVLRMLLVALPADEAAEGADNQALAFLQATGGMQAYRRAVPASPRAMSVARFLLFERRYPDSVAAAVEAVHEALQTADSSPRTSEPVLRLSRLGADLEFRRRAAVVSGDLRDTCDIVQRELALVDSDIAQRYFAGARAGA